MAYDATDHETVLFGGCTANVCPDNYTWVFTGGRWTNITDPHDAPPARDLAGFAYDPNLDGVLLFGGDTGTAALNDTWLFSGGIWYDLTSVGAAPPARIDPMMAFDPDPEVNGTFLFGGCDATCYNDTWAWEGSGGGWVRLHSSIAPPEMEGGMMAFDPVSDYMVLFGGELFKLCGLVPCSTIYSSTWEFYGGEWWLASPTGGTPPGPTGGEMTWDPNGERLIVYGGETAGGALLNTSWDFSSNAWRNNTGKHPPPARTGYAEGPDSSGVPPIIFGGYSTGDPYRSDTWVFEQRPTVALAAPSSTVEASTPVTFNVTTGYGTPPYVANVSFDDGSFSYLTGAGPKFTAVHVFAKPGTYVVTVNVTDSLGVVSPTPATVTIAVSAAPAVSVAAELTTGDAGYPGTFTAVGSAPGAPSFTYHWSFDDGTPNQTGSPVTHTFESPGSYNITVNATDSLGGYAVETLPYLVEQPPTIFGLSSLPKSPGAGAAVGFEAVVQGGTPPYSYTWSFGDRQGSTASSPTTTFASSGNYTVQLWLNDSDGVEAHAERQITVAAPSSSSPGAPPLWFWGGLGGLAAVAAVGTVLLRRRAAVRPPP